MSSENCKSLVVQDKCNIVIVLPPEVELRTPPLSPPSKKSKKKTGCFSKIANYKKHEKLATIQRVKIVLFLGPHCKRMRRSERQQSLREQYFFTCNCLPCLDGAEQEEIFSVSKASITTKVV